MNVKFEKSLANGVLNAPPSKSYAHRALICASFSKKSVVKNIALSDDIKATLNCLIKLGITADVSDNQIIINGFNRENIVDGTVLDCNESGSTLRFLIPICFTFEKEIIFKGSKRLLQRPLDEYKKLADIYGFKFDCYEDYISLKGNMKSGSYEISGAISSQFITGMIFALSFLDGKSSLKIIGNTESKPYIDLTLDTLLKFGITTAFDGDTIDIFGKNTVEDNCFTAEGDCSNSAYIESFDFLNNAVSVNGINDDTLQGDYIYKTMFLDIKNGVRKFDLSNCPDLAPVMFAVSSLFGGATFIGTKRLKYKESDRSLAMKTELQKFGVKTQIYENSVIIDANDIHKPNDFLFSHNDHRIVMALSLLCSKFGGIILGADAVNKSYPEFFCEIKKLGVNLEEYDT